MRIKRKTFLCLFTVIINVFILEVYKGIKSVLVLPNVLL